MDPNLTLNLTLNLAQTLNLNPNGVLIKQILATTRGK